jgi:hypothetical protein
MAQLYDIIGDLHGHADELAELLAKMDYENHDGVWSHPDRIAIFVGDFIDLGPKQVETVMIAKRMVEAGTAHAVLGNHDLNAIAWYLPDPTNPGDFLRSRFSAEWGAKNRHQHSAFLAEVEGTPIHGQIIDWFLTLPLWLDLAEFRVVHACWHSSLIAFLSPFLPSGNLLNSELMLAATREVDDVADKRSAVKTIFTAVEMVTKGPEISLPSGYSFIDNNGIRRTQMRTRWWDTRASTFREAALLEPMVSSQLPDTPLPFRCQVYDPADKPVFIGHYWLSGQPAPLSEKVICVDYSVGKGGPLTAYRWEPGQTPDSRFFAQT